MRRCATKSANCARPFSRSRCRGRAAPVPSARPGLRGTPAAPENKAAIATDVLVRRIPLHRLRCPWMCMQITPAPVSRQTSTIAGSNRNPEMSFTISAPAATAWRATSALVVSMEIGTSILEARRSMTGMTRRSSSCNGTGSAPGRVDSPPMSSAAAPSAISCNACSTAESRAMNRPPSEKLSGVMFKMPINRGVCDHSNERSRNDQLRRDDSVFGIMVAERTSGIRNAQRRAIYRLWRGNCFRRWDQHHKICPGETVQFHHFSKSAFFARVRLTAASPLVS